MSIHFVVRVHHTVIEAGVLILLPQLVLARRRRQALLVVNLRVALVAPDHDDDDDEGDGYDDEPYQHSETEVRTDEVVAPGAVLQKFVCERNGESEFSYSDLGDIKRLLYSY